MKTLRYCGVSALNMVVGSSVLWTCHAVLGWAAVVSNLSACVVSAGPAYLMSRRWVWCRRGRHRLSGEVLAFWLMALAGLGLSTLAVGLVARYTQQTVLVVSGNLGAYGAIWIAKYLYLDRVVWSGALPGASSSSERPGGPAPET